MRKYAPSVKSTLERREEKWRWCPWKPPVNCNLMENPASPVTSTDFDLPWIDGLAPWIPQIVAKLLEALGKGKPGWCNPSSPNPQKVAIDLSCFQQVHGAKVTSPLVSSKSDLDNVFKAPPNEKKTESDPWMPLPLSSQGFFLLQIPLFSGYHVDPLLKNRYWRSSPGIRPVPNRDA